MQNNIQTNIQLGKLIITGLPIGNYADISPRALDTLKNAQLILCEDTRESNILLLNFGIQQKKLISYIGSYNTAINSAKRAINDGIDVVLICDRGMPCISDPGASIVNILRKNGAKIVCVPGPSAVTTAFAMTGYTGSFIFHGFLPRKEGEIRKLLVQLLALDYNIIFFESPIRLENTLKIFAQIIPEREITLARELTKTYEQILQFQISECEKYKQNFKGECVLIIKGT